MNNILKLKTKYAILFILIVISVFSIGFANAKYLSKVNLNDNVQLAKPVLEIEPVSTSTTFSDLLPGGEPVEYYFNINNTDGNSDNEVLMNYYIKVSYPSENYPLTYTVYRIEDEVETPLTMSSDETDKVELGYEGVENHNYKIVFEWPEAQNDVKYAGQDFSIDVNVFAEQVIE